MTTEKDVLDFLNCLPLISKAKIRLTKIKEKNVPYAKSGGNAHSCMVCEKKIADDAPCYSFEYRYGDSNEKANFWLYCHSSCYMKARAKAIELAKEE